MPLTIAIASEHDDVARLLRGEVVKPAASEPTTSVLNEKSPVKDVSADKSAVSAVEEKKLVPELIQENGSRPPSQANPEKFIYIKEIEPAVAELPKSEKVEAKPEVEEIMVLKKSEVVLGPVQVAEQPEIKKDNDVIDIEEVEEEQIEDDDSSPVFARKPPNSVFSIKST